MGDIEMGKCKGCGGRCCNDISLRIDYGDIKAFKFVGNKLKWVDKLPEPFPDTRGVLYISKTPYIDNPLPILRVYSAVLPGSCGALANGICIKYRFRPNVCRYFIAGKDCHGPK